MNLKNMERIILVAEEKNITNASKKLFISQPTLSTEIQAIEKEVGIQIFERKRKQLKLTRAGEQYIKTAKKMLSTWNSFRDNLKSVNEEITEKIRIGISTRRSLATLPSVLPLFRKKHPQIGIKLEECITSISESILAEGAVDMVFCNQIIQLPNINSIRLKNELFVIASHKDSSFSKKYKDYIYSGKGEIDKKIPFSHLANEVCILPNTGSDERARYQYMANEANVTKYVSLEAYSSVIAQKMVENKVGTAIFPKNQSKSGELLPKSDNINYFLIDSAFASRQFYLNYFAGMRKSMYCKDLINIIAENFGYDQ